MSCIRLALVLTFLLGACYPLGITLLSQILLEHEANGSLVKDESGAVVGSELIGQSFEAPGYFHGRYSSTGYDASDSGSTNYGPSNEKLRQRAQRLAAGWPDSDVPLDLITNSASGLDPHISVQAAWFQAPRVAEATGLSREEIGQLIERNAEMQGVLGRPYINVLKLNLALRHMLSRSKSDE